MPSKEAIMFNQSAKYVSTVLAGIVITTFLLNISCADDDHHEDHESKYLSPVDNETYKQVCGACHFVYQPGLLPSGSWQLILDKLPSHFGNELSITPESRSAIGAYLRANAAEHSSAKRARKILRSLHGQTPIRISETPYIREKHHEIDQAVFQRPAIGSRSNCPACHSTADRGIYDDDYVRIPK
jgi:hypothetical protein